jgi:hypothetical protein
LDYRLRKTERIYFRVLAPYIALNIGILSALFDDLIDKGFENLETIQQLISGPDKTNVESQQSKIPDSGVMVFLNLSFEINIATVLFNLFF